MDEQLIQLIKNQYNPHQEDAYTPNVLFDIEHRDECIAQLQTRLRGLHRTYTDHLTVEQLAHILDNISQDYTDLANIHILDWQHENIRNRCCELYNRVKEMLKECGLRKPGMRAITTIISSVFGSIPVITKEMVRGLHYLGLLPHDTTESFRRVWDAISNFIHNEEEAVVYILTIALNLTHVAIAGIPAGDILLILYYVGRIIYNQRNGNRHHHRRN